MVYNSLGADGRYDIGSSNDRSYGSGYGKIEVYPLGEKSFGSETRTEVGAYVRRSYGKNSVKFERYPLVHSLGPGFGTLRGSSGGSFSNSVLDGNIDSKIEGS